MTENLSLFDLQEKIENQSLFDNTKSLSIKLDVVKMEFQEALTISWEELFEGYDRLYAITYSSGIDFVCALLRKFDHAEIIFGCDEVISYSLQEIVAYQLKTNN